MPSSRWRRLLATLLIAWPLVASPKSVAETQSQDTQPTFRTEANYVRVDVNPTAAGVPVSDLRKEDFEILEDNVPQTIYAFEHVVVRGGGPQETRAEPNTVGESRAMLENPRARVFVLFLDTYHVTVAGSSNLRKILIDALDRAVGPDDLIGVMTPEMSASDISFARKTTALAGILDRHWSWGERDQLLSQDPEESAYRLCYPPSPSDSQSEQVAEEMIERRREKRTIDALRDLVTFLRGAREERKAILAISEGWRLFTPNPKLARALDGAIPGRPEIGIDPRTGRPTAGTAPGGLATKYNCDRDRLLLSQIDDDQTFREMLNEANRSNASFYPIDPRGLVVFDEPIMKLGGSGPPPPAIPPSVNRARLQARLDSLRLLASTTEGLAIVQRNDLAGGLKRVVDDLSSYYLLAYYSTGRLDGRFHSIRVRVKRPGVQIRARNGYRAASAAQTSLERRATPEAALTSPVVAETRALENVLAPLDSAARDRPIRLLGVAGWTASGGTIWTVGELSGPEWKEGASVDVILTDRAGDILGSAHVELAPSAPVFRTRFSTSTALQPGEYGLSARVRSRSTEPRSAVDSLTVPLHATPTATGAILFRRGPSTGGRDVVTADVRFRRTERIRIEVPRPSGEAGAARLLDRNGKPLALEVAASIRTDPDGSRWKTAEVSLAPLAPGDYVIELSGDLDAPRSLFGFRLVR
jgi:VWFA-related protein